MRLLQVAVIAIICASSRTAAADPPINLVDQLDAMIGLLPFSDAARGKQAVLVEGSVDNNLLSFRSLDRAKMRAAMIAALNRRGITTVEPVPTSKDPFQLVNLAATAGLGLHYEVTTDGTDLEITVYTYTRPRAPLIRMEHVVDGKGAVSWNVTKLSTLGLVFFVIAGVIVFLRIRRRSADDEYVAPVPVVVTPPVRPSAPVLPTPAPQAPAPIAAPRPPTDDAGIPLSEGALAMLTTDAPVELELSGPLPPPKGHVRAATASTAALPGAPPVAQRDRPTKILDRYRIVDELGRGAMGVVYRAYDENLEREVAIKAMSEALHDHPDALRMFASEAKALAQLNHQNIVSIYDQFSERGKSYLIMELVDGVTLERILRDQGPYAPTDALRITYRLCNGLAYAHGRSVVHRDIKPANIFLTGDGDVKLGDFGLARVLREVAIRSTEVRGTPLYMAPEQVTGTNIDHRADLYAVGCTLFELLTGRPPFISGEIMYQQVAMPPPSPSSVVGDIPLDIDRLVLALLAKRPEDRPASAHDVRAAIRAIAT